MKSQLVSVALLSFLGVVITASSDHSGRIVGGTDATLAQNPFMVSLRQQNEHFCGGFIFNNRWIVTAAHCVRSRTVEQITAHMGTNSLTEPGVTQNIIRKEIHEAYDWQRVLNNIAMIQTAGVIATTGLVGTLPIAVTETPSGTMATVSGWGRTAVAGNLAENLQVLQVQIITRAACLAQHTVVNQRFIYENTTCTSSPVGQGLCGGDGGSPLFIGEGVNRQAVGIASWNMPCGTGVPDVYVRLSDYLSWINLTGLL